MFLISTCLWLLLSAAIKTARKNFPLFSGFFGEWGGSEKCSTNILTLPHTHLCGKIIQKVKKDLIAMKRFVLLPPTPKPGIVKRKVFFKWFFGFDLKWILAFFLPFSPVYKIYDFTLKYLYLFQKAVFSLQMFLIS